MGPSFCPQRVSDGAVVSWLPPTHPNPHCPAPQPLPDEQLNLGRGQELPPCQAKLGGEGEKQACAGCAAKSPFTRLRCEGLTGTFSCLYSNLETEKLCGE